MVDERFNGEDRRLLRNIRQDLHETKKDISDIKQRTVRIETTLEENVKPRLAHVEERGGNRGDEIEDIKDNQQRWRGGLTLGRFFLGLAMMLIASALGGLTGALAT